MNQTQTKTTETNQQDQTSMLFQEKIEKPKPKISEARREYLRQYYQKNKDKAREYQRRYNLTHKKKSRLSTKDYISDREVIRSTFTPSDIMNSPIEKSIKIIDWIMKGERDLTM